MSGVGDITNEGQGFHGYSTVYLYGDHGIGWLSVRGHDKRTRELLLKGALSGLRRDNAHKRGGDANGR